MRLAATGVLLLLLPLAAAAAADRLDEDAMFGAPGPGPGGQAPASGENQPALEDDPSPDAAALPDDAVDKPFQAGGIAYQRWVLSKRRGAGFSDASRSRPLQLDAFLDARPNDRVRAFVDARWLYHGAGDFNTSSAGGGSSTTAQNTPDPDARIDQAWLKFDIHRTVFITAGKQHIKWGTARYWNPTDFINTERRDSLATYDLREGKKMVKFAVPTEATQTNYYAIAFRDDADAPGAEDRTGGAFRVETVLGPAEVGADLVVRENRPPAYGLDISTPLGAFDVYAEVAITTSPMTVYELNGPLTGGAELSTLLAANTREGPFFHFSGGANYSFAWRENRQATVGAEYFYNPAGYDDPAVYPALVLLGRYQPLYIGRHYAALYLTAEGLDSAKKTSYTLATLSNLSDKSYLTRLSVSWLPYTRLAFESYVQFHHGREGGEFTFALDTPPMTYLGAPVPAVNVPATAYDLGLSVRLSF